MNADGTAQTRLTTNPAYDMFPAFSPEGNKVAFSSTRDGNWEIYAIGADGSLPTRITTNPAPDLYPDWGVPAPLP
jgi:Tol biopolymer transport system component